MSNHSVAEEHKDGIVLVRANSRKYIHIPMEQIESHARECGRTCDEIIDDLHELIEAGAMGEGWDVSRFYNMPVTASEEEGWDVSRFYSMPTASDGWDVSRFYNMPANAAPEGWDVSRFYSMPERGEGHQAAAH